MGGIAFQHFERGPKMRLARIEKAVRESDWDGLVELFPESAWAEFPWSREATAAFLKKYVEPKAGSHVETKLTHGWLNIYVRRVTRFDPSDAQPVFGITQLLDDYTIFSTSTSRLAIPTGWSETLPSQILMIRRVAPLWYPHPEVKKQPDAESLSEYEFYTAEKKALSRIGIDKLRLKPTLGVGTSIESYQANRRSLTKSLASEFDKVDAKYGAR